MKVLTPGELKSQFIQRGVFPGFGGESDHFWRDGVNISHKGRM